MKKIAPVLILLCGFAVGGCTPTEAVRGNLLQDYQLAEVKTGTDTQPDVTRKLGSPTTIAPFDPNVWYYMGQRTSKRGILDPKILEERIVVVTFDKSGVVQTVKDDRPQRLDFPYDHSKTPTSGSDITVMQQMLGNLGKFNKADTGKGHAGAGDDNGTAVP